MAPDADAQVLLRRGAQLVCHLWERGLVGLCVASGLRSPRGKAFRPRRYPSCQGCCPVEALAAWFFSFVLFDKMSSRRYYKLGGLVGGPRGHSRVRFG